MEHSADAKIPMESSAPSYYFNKGKLPRGWSYPLKRTFLDAALNAAGIDSVMFVHYSFGAGRQRSCPLRVDYVGEAQPRGAAGLMSITLYAVPSADRRAVMQALEAELTSVCAWMQATEAASPTWRSTDHKLLVEFVDGQARAGE